MEYCRMVVCGIVAEYNPFHRGHLLHIERSRRMAADGRDCAVVAVMSGNFVQRGDLAAFGKHARAEAACRTPGGPDLVIELPSPYAAASAEMFSSSAVYLLESCGIVTHLSFGSEAGDIESLKTVADFIDSDEFTQYLEAELEGGALYPAARQRAVQRKLGASAEIIRSPNNILGIEYLRALSKLGSAMRPITIRRMGAGHDSGSSEDSIASASNIRSMLYAGQAGRAMSYIPEGAAGVFMREIALGAGPISMEMGDQAILSQLRRMSAADFGRLSDAGEGLNFRIAGAVRMARSAMEAADLAKTKRYTHSRIRRILLRAYLGITSEWESVPPPYIRVLAFNGTGRELLKKMRTASTLPVITKPADARKLYSDETVNGAAIKKLIEAEALATDLYMLLCPSADLRRAGYELSTSPIYVQ